MNFTHFCVGVVIFIIITIITGVSNYIDRDWSGTGWLLACIGFAICLTVLLFEKGII